MKKERKKMAILNRDDLMAKLKEHFGEDTDDASLSFIEDVTDTYDDLASKSNVTALSEMTQKYDDLQKKYRERFFSGGDDYSNEDDHEQHEEPRPKLRFEDLFTEVE